ncbi:hypothetical protein J2Z83_003940 [Virgibacillus natechei]|uniref:Uncharacterized protein n=1 Tax=Virgibacillus natechei TaxID=1216297 RepID=A0ABS4ILE5_9BACI|nr:hypothetical protein [Virgibacillus natechei]MBP1971785.1 hypothetical protein [Virgibacillus natechei]UZD13779.1 hypothetical protein OLD84_04290 [Virgibacillus natechei]
MKEKTPLVFYGTIIGLISFGVVLFGLSLGATPFFVLVLAALTIYLSSKFLPDLWASIIMAVVTVICIHYLFQLWSLTITLLCYWIFLILADYMIKNKKWSRIAIIVVTIIFFVILFFLAITLALH